MLSSPFSLFDVFNNTVIIIHIILIFGDGGVGFVLCFLFWLFGGRGAKGSGGGGIIRQYA